MSVSTPGPFSVLPSVYVSQNLSRSESCVRVSVSEVGLLLFVSSSPSTWETVRGVSVFLPCFVRDLWRCVSVCVRVSVWFGGISKERLRKPSTIKSPYFEKYKTSYCFLWVTKFKTENKGRGTERDEGPYDRTKEAVHTLPLTSLRSSTT